MSEDQKGKTSKKGLLEAFDQMGCLGQSIISWVIVPFFVWTLWLAVEAILSPIYDAISSIERKNQSITDKNYIEMKVIQRESRESFSISTEELSEDEKEEFCKEEGFNRMHKHTDNTIFCEFNY